MRNKVLFLVFLFSCLITLSIFSAEKSIIEYKNSYGGRTIKYIFSLEDSEYGTAISAEYYYNVKGTIEKIIYYFNEKTQKETGYIRQENNYKSGIVASYKMVLTEDEKNYRGYDYVIEYINESDEIILYEYVKGDIKVLEDPAGFPRKYPFLKLKVVKDLLTENYVPNEKGDVYTFYHYGRSFIQFNGTLKDLDSKDKELISIFFKSRKQEQFAEIYTKKVIVNEDGNNYTAYIQNELTDYVVNEKTCLLTFFAMGLNDGILLFATAINDSE